MKKPQKPDYVVEGVLPLLWVTLTEKARPAKERPPVQLGNISWLSKDQHAPFLSSSVPGVVLYHENGLLVGISLDCVHQMAFDCEPAQATRDDS